MDWLFSWECWSPEERPSHHTKHWTRLQNRGGTQGLGHEKLEKRIVARLETLLMVLGLHNGKKKINLKMWKLLMLLYGWCRECFHFLQQWQFREVTPSRHLDKRKGFFLSCVRIIFIAVTFQFKIQGPVEVMFYLASLPIPSLSFYL